MDNYLIIFFDKKTLEITESDFNNLIGKEGLVAIKSVGEVVNMSAVARIIPKSRADELEDRRNQKEGILHDGMVVIRYFGSWYMDGEFDEHGKPMRRIDSAHYPEVARDCVPTKKEFETKYRMLPREKRLELIVEGTREPRISGGLKQIGETLGNRIKQIAKIPYNK